MIRYLLVHTGVEGNRVNLLGWTGLLESDILSDGGPAHPEVVRSLLADGADPDLADRDGLPPIAQASLVSNARE